MLESFVTLPLLAKAAPILIPIAGALMKHLIGDDKKLYQELLGAAVDGAGDIGKDRLEEVLKQKPDLALALNEHVFMRYTGWVIGELIRQFAGKAQFEAHQDELIKLADAAPAGWITFLKRGSPGLTPVQQDVFLRAMAASIARDGSLPAVDSVPFITFINWHVRLPAAVQQQLDTWLKQHLDTALKALLLQENQEAQQAWKQIIHSGIQAIHQELHHIQEELRQHGELLEDLRESPGFNLDHYAEKLILHCERIPFSSKAENKGAAPIKLSTIFVEPSLLAHEELDPELLAASRDVAQAVRDGTIDQLSPEQQQIARKLEEKHRQATSAPAFQTLYESGETGHIILAHAGVGKSSLVRRMALLWAVQMSQPSDAEAPPPLPLLIELKTFANAYGSDPSLSLLAFLHQCEESIDRLDRVWCLHYLRTGAAVLILDGLDEVSQTETRKAIANGASRLRRLGVRVIVTSRREGFLAGHWQQQTTPWSGWLLEEFSREQRATFIGLMLPRLYASDGEWKKKQAELERRFVQQPAIRQLSTNPLLLTLITVLQRTGRLGDNRLALYKEAAELLLDQWEAEHFGTSHVPLDNGIPCDAITRREIIRRLALKLIAPDDSEQKSFAENLFSIEILKDAIREVVDPAGVNPGQANMSASHLPDYLNERHSVICFSGEHAETRERLFSFIHRTFLEYFIALAWVDEIDNENAADPEHCRVFLMGEKAEGKPRWSDARFANILPFYFGLLSDIFLKKRLPLLWELVPSGENDTAAVFFATSVWAEMSSTRDRKHPEFGTSLQERLIALAERTAKDDHLIRTVFEEYNQCQDAVRALAQLFGNSSRVESWLTQKIADNACPSILRRSCTEQFLLLHGPSSAIQELLWQAATQADTHAEFRHTALRTLGTHWGEECLIKAILEINHAAELDTLRLSNCTVLSQLPDLQHMTGLQYLDLSGCTGFQNAEALAGFQSLPGLRTLYLSDCTGLSQLPDLQHMTSLQQLYLNGCTGLQNAEALAGLPPFSGIGHLDLSDCTGLSQLPEMQHLRGLKFLDLRYCTGLQDAEGLKGLSELESLILLGCSRLTRLPDWQNMTALKSLDLDGCTGLQGAHVLDGLVELNRLERLDLSNCQELTSLPDLRNLSALKEINVYGCMKLPKAKALKKLLPSSCRVFGSQFS